jgi:exonuclease VII large subunit|tara:strand:+ start:6438 stop:6608 length:171 start_codon:yes stop_codon:yes gene_type:complete
MKYQPAAIAMAPPASAQRVGIATSSPGSLLRDIGAAVAKTENEARLNAPIQPATSL